MAFARTTYAYWVFHEVFSLSRVHAVATPLTTTAIAAQRANEENR